MSLKIDYKVNDDVRIGADVKDVEQAFQLVAYLTSVLGVKRCANCDGPNLVPVHRTPKGYDYYSLQCNDCHHELKISKVQATGKLYAKGWEEPFNGSRATTDDASAPAAEQEPAAKGTSSANDDFPF